MKNGLPVWVRRQLDPLQRYELRILLLIAAMVLVAVPFATLLFQVLAEGPITRLDSRLANDLNRAVHHRDGIVGFLKFLSFLGGPPLLTVLVVAAAAYVLWRNQLRLAVFLVVTSAGGGIVDTIVKILVDRPRPLVDHAIATAHGKSFPSGHAMSSTVVYGALLVVFLPALRGRFRQALVVATCVIVAGVGSSRLMLGVHFVSDVVGGFVLGLAWLAGSVAVFETWRVERGQRPSEPFHEGVEPEAGAALRGDASG